MLDNPGSIAAVVVTHNRRALLSRCLTSLLNQSYVLDEIIVVDNASTDGTRQMLAADFAGVTVLALPENLGGTGGFAKGMQVACQRGHGWLWLMDDDLLPALDALEQLVQTLAKVSRPAKTFIGGLAQDDSGRLVWNLKLDNQWLNHTAELRKPAWPAGFEVDYLPFLGLLVPSAAVDEAGLPRADFFVYLDDVEYCYRAKKHGYTIICVPQSKLFHPVPPRSRLQLFNQTIFIERLPGWKSYYEVRNRILLGLEYERVTFWKHLLPVVLLRMLLSLIWYKEERVSKLGWYALGLWDGFRGYTGRRVLP